MSDFQIVPATEGHLAAALADLRDEHYIAMVSCGLNPATEIGRTFDETPYPQAWLIGDLAVGALFGVCSPLMSHIGMVWLVLTKRGARYPIAVVKETKRRLAVMQRQHAQLWTTLPINDPRAALFAHFFGFRAMHGCALRGWPLAKRIVEKAEAA